MTIHLLHGSITVRAYNGHEVIVDTKGVPDGQAEKTHEGMHRIAGGTGDVTIESENNKVSISSQACRARR